jgi:hypothetical protein
VPDTVQVHCDEISSPQFAMHPLTPPPQESILTAVAYVSFQPQIMYLLPHFIY